MNAARWKVGAEASTPADTADASEAIWQDPSSYNPYTQGPPYLPPVMRSHTASVQDVVTLAQATPNVVLPAILTLLRALAMVHQSHHWLTYGPPFYQDHLLFERLYNAIVAEIDKIAERAVGTGADKSALHPGVQAKQVAACIASVCGDGITYGEGENPESYVTTSLKAERWFLEAVAQLAEGLKAAGKLSRGTDNLLQGIEDKHEEHVYLLLQRTGGDQAWKKDTVEVWAPKVVSPPSWKR